MTTRRDAVTVPLVRYQELLPSFTAIVAGAERRVLFDTGVGITTLSEALATELGHAPEGQLTGPRMSGELVTLVRGGAATFDLGATTLEVEVTGSVALQGLLPPDWPTVDAVLGLDALATRPFALEDGCSAITLMSEAELEDRVRVWDELTIDVRRPLDGLGLEVHVAAAWGGQPIWLELDTGNASEVVLNERLGHATATATAPRTVDLEIAGLGSWATEAWVVPLILDGNLGRTFFADRTVALDLAAGRMWATAPRRDRARS